VLDPNPILERLEGVSRIGNSGTQWLACCPAHDDRKASLSIGIGRKGLVLSCHAGCKTVDVLARIGLTFRDLYDPDEDDGPKRQRKREVMKASAPRPAAAERPALDFAALHRKCLEDDRLDGARPWLASHLKVRPETLGELEVGYHGTNHEYYWPERDGAGKIIGLGRREIIKGRRLGQKTVLGGSKRGLLFSEASLGRSGPSVWVEGMSDTLALWSMGFGGGGRASATLGKEHLAELVAAGKVHPRKTIVIVADNDTSGKGREGAEETARHLARRTGRTVLLASVPGGAKDTREWFTAWLQAHDATAESLEACTRAGDEYCRLLLAKAEQIRPSVEGGEHPEGCEREEAVRAKESGGAKGKKKRKSALAWKPDALADAELDAFWGLSKPPYCLCPHATGMTFAETRYGFDTGKERHCNKPCGSPTCPSCRPYYVWSRARWGCVHLMRVKVATRMTMPAGRRLKTVRQRLDRENLRRLAKDPHAPLMSSRVERLGDEVVLYVYDRIDWSYPDVQVEHMTGPEAVKRLVADATDGKLAGLERTYRRGKNGKLRAVHVQPISFSLDLQPRKHEEPKGWRFVEITSGNLATKQLKDLIKKYGMKLGTVWEGDTGGHCITYDVSGQSLEALKAFHAELKAMCPAWPWLEDWPPKEADDG
jgi:hypothetical protein